MTTRSTKNERKVLFKRRLARRLVLMLFPLIAHIEISGLENIRDVQGKAIIASNHLGRLDGVCGLLVVKRLDLILVMTDKYRESAFYRFLVDQLDLLWLDRKNSDISTMKEVLRRLERGGLLMITPEGTRSKTEALLPGEPGVAYLAAKSGAPVIPAAVIGTEDRVVKENFKKFRRQNIRLTLGKAYQVPALPKKDREVFLRQQTDEIMARVAALLPEKYRGVYAKDRRLAGL